MIGVDIIEKNERVNALFEFYGPLLTKKQHAYLQLYYGDDYSLGEIADEFHVSRQAVYDNIKRTVKTLQRYEAKMHLLQAFDQRNDELDQLTAYIKQHYAQDSQLLKMINHLNELEAE